MNRKKDKTATLRFNTKGTFFMKVLTFLAEYALIFMYLAAKKRVEPKSIAKSEIFNNV